MHTYDCYWKYATDLNNNNLAWSMGSPTLARGSSPEEALRNLLTHSQYQGEILWVVIDPRAKLATMFKSDVRSVTTLAVSITPA